MRNHVYLIIAKRHTLKDIRSGYFVAEKPAHLILMQATRSQGKRFAVWSVYGKTTLPRPVCNANRSKNIPSRRAESCG